MENNDEDMEVVNENPTEVTMEDDNTSSSSSSDDDDDDEPKVPQGPKEVYLPSKPLKEGEELVCDESAYVMLHQAHTGAPCLSFDILEDELGNDRENYPLTAYIVAGTQAARTHVNNVIVMKMHNLHRTSKVKEDDDDDDDESDSSDSDEENEDENDANKKPQMSCALIKHQGCVNRIRSKRLGNTVVAATWSELGRVNIWNLNEQMLSVDDPKILKKYEKNQQTEPSKPMFSFSGHQKEGFAIDWSPIASGVLATGDCRRDIHVWQPIEETGTWKVDQRPLTGHTDSVEDIQWSPNEKSVMASCSVDKSIRIWDCRAPPQKACMLACEGAHESDVNVISWNRNEPFIVSGGDDGFLHIWDLRQFATTKKPVATFKHHTNHVTSVEWHPKDSTVLVSGGSDDQIAIWDLAVEKDQDQETTTSMNKDELSNLPPQLLFIHQGQQDVKEVHWHPQLPGVLLSTAHSGFNVFRTISV